MDQIWNKFEKPFFQSIFEKLFLQSIPESLENVNTEGAKFEQKIPKLFFRSLKSFRSASQNLDLNFKSDSKCHGIFIP